MNKTLSLILIIFLCFISSLLLLYGTFSESEVTMTNFNLLKNLVITYLVIYISISIIYFKDIIKREKSIKHEFFIYGQVYNFIPFLLLQFSLLDILASSIKNTLLLNVINNILNILFFPGINFLSYFKCLRMGLDCLGFDLFTVLIFNIMMFTTLGFILGLILESIKNKK